ncbi:hypothetical protein BO70DRAFT_393541 [Aspergillus heteromorphus CBS 117.55]|uniref:Uncharacterized protein n=1 Tax=Aspergillus heteromorphus CBS 117.55 TaxID=1448321 RepID=A0A317WRE1_9EURO|nr:uncharacterized protein BO70DRAFT_393541 [Aspergillus heteromorphus CBS 117.55]PWY89023.1 hypothetical protein BO70DRAFT_393541 [Aspergillus heteromorphus CBS 117.55]
MSGTAGITLVWYVLGQPVRPTRALSTDARWQDNAPKANNRRSERPTVKTVQWASFPGGSNRLLSGLKRKRLSDEDRVPAWNF